jgi:nitrite reductase/ring-hydroxylating ferredoxin subunit
MQRRFMTSSAHDVGAVTDFEVGQPQRVEIDGRALVVINVGDRFCSVRDTCPHQGARLSDGQCKSRLRVTAVGAQPEIQAGDLVLQCAWHGWMFDLHTGRTLTETDGRRVRIYPVRVQDSRVLVDIT